jgi:hypothetical protein
MLFNDDEMLGPVQSKKRVTMQLVRTAPSETDVRLSLIFIGFVPELYFGRAVAQDRLLSHLMAVTPQCE